MPLAPAFFTSRFTRTVVMWLLVLVLPAQGAAVGISSALGPAHVHRTEPGPLVLEDLRHWKPAPVAQAHVFASLGHFHASAAPQRHHHATGDASVVRTEGDGADGDEAPGASAVSVLALIPIVAAWTPPHGAGSIDPVARWVPRTGFVRALERPPRLG